MTKTQKTIPDPKPTVKLTDEQLRNKVETLVKETVMAECDPRNVIRTYDQLLTSYRETTGKDQEKIREKLHEKTLGIAQVFALDTHYEIAGTLASNRIFIIEFTNQLIKEYDCKTPSEKSLAQIVAGAYGRILEYSKLFNNSQRVEYLSSEKNGYYSMYSKEVDRAHRHYLSALTMLQQIKSPAIKVNIKTNTAFVAQNQQVNTHNPHEIIKEQ